MRPAVRALRTELAAPTGPSWSAAFNEALTGLIGLAPMCAGAVAWLVQDYQRRGIGRASCRERV